jgi:hypothetical protein
MRYLSLFVVLLYLNAASAQDSLRWNPAKLNQLAFTIKDDNDKVVGRTVFRKTRTDSSHKPSILLYGSIISYAERSSGYGSDKFSETYMIKTDTAGFYVDYGLLRNFSGATFRKTEVVIIRDNALLFYPKNPQIGQQLPSGMTAKLAFYMEESGFGDPAKRPPFMAGNYGNSLTLNESYTRIDERKIIEKEFKTIMGKKLETYVIQQTISTAHKSDGKYKEGGYMKEWYNPGAGLVAFAIYTKKDKMIISGELTSVQ